MYLIRPDFSEVRHKPNITHLTIQLLRKLAMTKYQDDKYEKVTASNEPMTSLPESKVDYA